MGILCWGECEVTSNSDVRGGRGRADSPSSCLTKKGNATAKCQAWHAWLDRDFHAAANVLVTAAHAETLNACGGR